MEQIFLELLGKTTAEAKAMVEPDGYSLRVIEQDGSGRMVTMDHNIKRINVAITKDIITKIRGLG